VSPTHILFDFFGTLVDYGEPVEYARTLRHLAMLDLSYPPEEFVRRWNASWEPFEERCRLDHREFSMIEVATAFLAAELGRPPTASEVDDLVNVYIAEWNDSVLYLDGLRDWIDALSRRFRLAIVSNTHESRLVPAHLAAMGIADYFDVVVLSVDVGWRKPHPQIYAAALERLGIQARDAVFVGDTHVADYVGPQEIGMNAYLIDPGRLADVPSDRRLSSVLDLSRRLLD
jgi:putative hydrolase of the HAD superfamily